MVEVAAAAAYYDSLHASEILIMVRRGLHNEPGGRGVRGFCKVRLGDDTTHSQYDQGSHRLDKICSHDFHDHFLIFHNHLSFRFCICGILQKTSKN